MRKYGFSHDRGNPEKRNRKKGGESLFLISQKKDQDEAEKDLG